MPDKPVSLASEPQQNDLQWRAVLESTQTGVWDWNAQTNKVYFSPAWKAMLGYADDEIGDGLEEWDSRIHPEDRASTYADLERHFSGQVPLYENTHRMRCKDGSYKWILDRGKVFSFDESGKPLRVIGTHTDVTESHEQKKLLERLAANTPGVLCQFRLYPDGRTSFPYASAGMLDVYGHAPEEIAADANLIFDGIHPDDLDRVRQRIMVSAETLQVWEDQYRYMHPVKGERWIEGRTTPQKLADGSVLWSGHLYDITERKQQELELAETSTRLQLTLEATDTGLWFWDLTTNLVRWSAQTYQHLGYAPDAFPVSIQRFRELIHPDDLAPTEALLKGHLEEGKEYRTQFRLRHAQGHWVWIDACGKVVLRDEKGQPSMMAGTQIDITSIKKTQEQLLESERRLSQLAAHSRTVTWEVDANGLYTYVSPVCEAVWGYSVEELVGKKHFYDLHPEEGRDQLIQQAFSAMAQGLPLKDLENPIQHKDGPIVWVVTHGYPVWDASGRLGGYQGSDRDITDQKKAEQQLQEAMVAAEEANQAKSEFLANMSHEIRTPMNGIIGLSELSLDESDQAVLHDRLRKINQSGRMLLGIINDILDFSKIEAGKMDIVAHPFLLPRLLDNLHSLFGQMAEKKGVALKISAEASLEPAYTGDELRLRQVLTNLLSNAIKFTDHGSVSLEVVRTDETRGIAQLMFKIRDTGVGIGPEQQSRLFQAFSQGDSSITRKHGGTGLGLVISQRLVHAMGGSGITLDSEPQRGACFSFSLPLRPCTVQEQQALLQAEGSRHDPGTQLAGKVLLVEDNPINQEVAIAQLRKFGLQVVLAKDGAEVLPQLRSQDFDLVLMDIQMPVMDGHEATRQLRSQGYTLPVIALTAAAMVEDQHKAMASGMNDHLGKPIDRRELQQVLTKWLKSEHRPAESIERSPELNGIDSNLDMLFDQAAGLELLGGNAALQRRLIEQFLQQQTTDFQPLCDELKALGPDSAAEAYKVTQQMAHTLKGVAGNLRLTKLALLAQTLDAALKRQQPPDPSLQQAFDEALQQTVAALNTWLANSELSRPVAPPSAVTAPRSLSRVLEDLHALQAAIHNSEYIDETRLQSIGPSLPPEMTQEWTRFCQLIDGFDFEQASQIVVRLIESMKERAV